ncbi:MAG TPA: hypothetical protein VFR31_17585 [Thermoanaerobaculia bacterium]|nr:hypothetical protein [Thermoanaerobaculia bacterium]
MTRVVLSLSVVLCLAASVTAARFMELRPAGSVAELTGLERDSHRFLVVGAAVPGDRAASCQARVLDAAGAHLGEERLEVEAGSSAQFDFAGVKGAADAQVSCDQPFHAYAAAAGPDEPRAIWGQGSGPGAACKHTLNASPSSLEPGMLGAVLLGDIHMPVPGNAPENRIGVVCINIPHDLSLNRLILEWDVTPGQWNPQYAPGSHNLVWLHRGSYVRNTVGNVNVFGRGGNFFAMNQNVDAPKPTTGRLRPADLILGGAATYHMTYTYDASRQRAFFAVSGGGKFESTDFVATAKDVNLHIPKKNRWSDSSLFVEFGHFGERKPGRGKPAVPTYGWRYSNLRLRMYPR